MNLKEELKRLLEAYEDMCSVIDNEVNDFWSVIEALLIKVEEEKE